IAHLGPGGRWLRVNDKLCEITGYSREELQALRAEDITHADDIAEGQRLAQRLWAGEIPMYTRAKRTIRKNGKIIWLALTCALVRKSDGAPDYVITFAQDISKEKQAEAALADSNAMLDSVIENLPAMVFLKRASDLAFVRFNRAGEK